jgi:hypothetical protein
VRRHDLQHEREEHENSAAPPARLRQKITGLANANERVGGSLSAEVGSKAAAFAALKQHGCNQHDSVDYEKR